MCRPSRSVEWSRRALLFVAVLFFACARPLPLVVPNLGHDTPVPRAVESQRWPSALPPRAVGSKQLGQAPLTSAGELPTLWARSAKRDQDAPLPLLETRFVVTLYALVAEVEVTQRFANPRQEPIEVVYDFPLPDNAAVSQMKLSVGQRALEGRIDEKAKARATYEAVRDAGHPAALVEQARANRFTQTIANVEPGAPLEVSVRYVQDLAYDEGVRELVIPMVVGPRFEPSGSAAAPLSPPRAGPGERTGADVSLTVVADPALAAGPFESPSHDVLVTKDPVGRAVISLAKKDAIANRDFVLRFHVAEAEPRAQLLLSAPEDGYFSLVVDPPDVGVAELLGQREVILVVDVSGSMKGAPLALAKRAAALTLAALRPTDRFDVLTFSGRTLRLFPAPRPATRANIDAALEMIDRAASGGGTMMLDALAEAFGGPRTSSAERSVLFFTDGFVSVEDELVKATREFVAREREADRRARVFGVGVGPAPNRALLEGVSREGDGVAEYLTARDDPERAASAILGLLDRAVLTDVVVDWGGATVADLAPAKIPDLFASHPLVVSGRFAKPPSRAPVLRANGPSGPIELPVVVSPVSKGDRRDVLGVLWARARIGALELDLAAGDASARQKITQLGASFGLLTRFTSFVAFDASRRSDDPARLRLIQPAEALDQAGADQPVTGALMQQESVARQTLNERSLAGLDGSEASGLPPPASPAAYRRGCACALAEPPRTRSFEWVALLAAALGARRRQRRRLRAIRPR